MEEQLGHIIQAWMLQKNKKREKENQCFIRNQDVFAAFSTKALNATSKNELKYLCYMKIKPKNMYSKKGVPSAESIPHCAGSGEGY